jgi:hypothetical protein
LYYAAKQKDVVLNQRCGEQPVSMEGVASMKRRHFIALLAVRHLGRKEFLRLANINASRGEGRYV